MYLERGEQFAQAMASHPPPVTEPFVLFHALKWNTADHTNRSWARYTCHPRSSAQSAAAYCGGLFRPGRSHAVAFVLWAGVGPVGAFRARALYLDVTEEGTDRRSFDVIIARA